VNVVPIVPDAIAWMRVGLSGIDTRAWRSYQLRLTYDTPGHPHGKLIRAVAHTFLDSGDIRAGNRDNVVPARGSVYRG